MDILYFVKNIAYKTFFHNTAGGRNPCRLLPIYRGILSHIAFYRLWWYNKKITPVPGGVRFFPYRRCPVSH